VISKSHVSQDCQDFVEWEANHIVIRPLNPLDESSAKTLHGVCPSFVDRFPSREIVLNLCICKDLKGNLTGNNLTGVRLPVGVKENESRHHSMGTTREQTQHAKAIGSITRFAENSVIDNDNRVCTQDPVSRMAGYDISRFFPCNSQRINFRGFSWSEVLICVARDDSKGHPCLLEQLSATRRRRSEDEVKGGISGCHGFNTTLND
jgi:hypothetical protein